MNGNEIEGRAVGDGKGGEGLLEGVGAALKARGGGLEFYLNLSNNEVRVAEDWDADFGEVFGAFDKRDVAESGKRKCMMVGCVARDEEMEDAALGDQ